MNVDGYKEEVARLQAMLEQVEKFSETPDGITLTPHLVTGEVSVHFTAESVEDMKAKLTASRAYLRENLGE